MKYKISKILCIIFRKYFNLQTIVNEIEDFGYLTAIYYLTTDYIDEVILGKEEK